MYIIAVNRDEVVIDKQPVKGSRVDVYIFVIRQLTVGFRISQHMDIGWYNSCIPLFPFCGVRLFSCDISLQNDAFTLEIYITYVSEKISETLEQSGICGPPRSDNHGKFSDWKGLPMTYHNGKFGKQ